jgi:DNA-binding beta-propeller fold protein YncE
MSVFDAQEVGVDPSEILVTPNGKRGYVSVRGENKIKELDLRRDCPSSAGAPRSAGAPVPPRSARARRRSGRVAAFGLSRRYLVGRTAAS